MSLASLAEPSAVAAAADVPAGSVVDEPPLSRTLRSWATSPTGM